MWIWYDNETTYAKNMEETRRQTMRANQLIEQERREAEAQAKARQAEAEAEAQEAEAEKKRIEGLLANRDIVFRDLAFGDSEEIIRRVWSNVKFKYGSEGNLVTLLADSNMNGDDCLLYLSLYKDQLYKIWLLRHSIPTYYAKDESTAHANMNALLEEKYGTPDSVEDKDGDKFWDLRHKQRWDKPTMTITSDIFVGQEKIFDKGSRKLEYLWKSPLAEEANKESEKADEDKQKQRKENAKSML